jgi:hypothetical protein
VLFHTIRADTVADIGLGVFVDISVHHFHRVTLLNFIAPEIYFSSSLMANAVGK